MAVHVVDIRRRQTRLLQCRGHGPGLAGHCGRQESALPAVVGQPDALYHPDDVVSGAFGVLEAFERDQRRPRGGNESVGVGVERARPARRAQRLQGGEPQMQEQVIGSVDSAGQHHVGVAVLQCVAGELDRVQRRRARRVQREGRPGDAHRLGDQMYRQSGGEPVARVYIVAAVPHALDERGAQGAGVGEVADDQACPWRGGWRAQSLAHAVREPADERVESSETGDARSDIAEIECVFDIATGRRGDPKAGFVAGQERRRIHPAPVIARGGRQQTAPGHGRLEQRLRGGRTGQDTAAPDDCDRFETAHAGASAPEPAT